MSKNLSFELDLFNDYHVSDPNFWNKLTSPIEHAEFINTFLMIFERMIMMICHTMQIQVLPTALSTFVACLVK